MHSVPTLLIEPSVDQSILSVWFFEPQWLSQTLCHPNKIIYPFIKRRWKAFDWFYHLAASFTWWSTAWHPVSGISGIPLKANSSKSLSSNSLSWGGASTICLSLNWTWAKWVVKAINDEFNSSCWSSKSFNRSASFWYLENKFRSDLCFRKFSRNEKINTGHRIPGRKCFLLRLQQLPEEAIFRQMVFLPNRLNRSNCIRIRLNFPFNGSQ